MNLTIRGLCPSDTKLMEGNFDSEYFIDGFRNNKAHWRGLGKSHIYYIKERKQWKLESFYDEDVKFAVLVADDSDPYAFYPLGRLCSVFFFGFKSTHSLFLESAGRSTLAFVRKRGM